MLIEKPYDEKSLRLIHIQGNFKEEILAATLSIDLKEVDLEHPTGLLRLKPDQAETNCQLTDTQLTLAINKRSQPAFSYEIKNISLNGQYSIMYLCTVADYSNKYTRLYV